MQKVLTSLVSDLDGEPAEKTTRFGLDGTDYEIDLSADQDEEFREALARYVVAARRATNGSKPGKSPRAPRGARGSTRPGAPAARFIEPARVPDNTTLRAWAQSAEGAEALRAAGVPEVKDRGRIGGEVLAVYQQARK